MSVHVVQYRTMRRRCGGLRQRGNETARCKITLTAQPGFHIY